MDDGERGLAFPEVGGDGLAKYLFGSGEVEHIVDDLKSQAEIAAVLAERLFDGFPAGSDGRAQLHGHLEKAGSLAKDQVEIFFLIDEVAELLGLEEFTLNHLLRKGDEEVENAEVAFGEGGLEALHIEPVARENTFGVAPGSVRRWTAAARVGFADDVVVDESGGVEHLDHGTEADARLVLTAKSFGAKKKQQRANALTAASHQIGGYLGDYRHR